MKQKKEKKKKAQKGKKRKIFKLYNLISFMDIKIILEEQEEGGFAIYVPALQGCVSQGETIEEALKNIREAIELYFEADENELIVYEDNLKTKIITI